MTDLAGEPESVERFYQSPDHTPRPRCAELFSESRTSPANHRLPKAVTALAIGNVGKLGDTVFFPPLPRGEGKGEGASAEGEQHHKPRSHDTSRIAWARLMARMGEEFPLECPNCGGDIRLIAFIAEPGPIRKILTHLGELLEPPSLAPARGPPVDWGELVQASDERDVLQASPDDLPVIDIHSL